MGRSLDDLKTCFPAVDLVSLGEKVLKDLNTVEMEILSTDLTWYTLKILPYRTTGNVIDGVVMTFLDIHTVKQADKTRRMTKDGSILSIWLTASALTDENGQMVEIAITERDLACIRSN